MMATVAAMLLLLLAYRHVFFPWSGLCGGDVIGFHAPFLAGLKRSISLGQPFPFWFNELCCGIPAIPDISATLLHPLYQLLHDLEVPTVIKLQIMLNLLLLFWGNYYWIRSHKIEIKTAYFWAFSSIFFFPIQGLLSFGHLGILSSISLLPWALVLTPMHGSPYPGQKCLKLGLVLGLAWLSGHPQLTLMIHEIVFLYLMFQWKTRQDWKGLLYFSCSCGIGVLLASPQLIPTAIHIFQSGRSESINDADFLNSGSIALLQIVRWFHPAVFGEEHSYWGQHSFWFGVLFSSPVLFILLLKGIVKLPRPALLCLIVCIVLALGAATPFYALRQHLVPGANLFRYSSRFVYLAGPFILLALIYGAQAFLENKKMKVLAWLGFLVSAGVLIITLMPQSWLENILPAQVLQRRAQVSQGSTSSMIIFVQLFLVLIMVHLSTSKTKRCLLVGLIALQVCLWGKQQFLNTQMHDWPKPLTLQSQGRVMSDLEDSPNLALTLGFESLTGYVGMTPKAYRNFLDTQTPQSYQKRNRIQCGGLSEECLDVLNVQQRIRNGVMIARHTSKNSFDTVAQSSGISTGNLTHNHSIHYSFAKTLLPLSLRPESAFSANLQAGQLAIAEKFRNRFHEDFLNDKNSDSGLAINSMQSQNAILNLQRSQEYVVIKTSSPNNGILVGMDNTHPFWQAFIDGKEVEIHAWLGSFRSVFVPKGEHFVEFKINRSIFKGAMVLSMLALCLILATLSYLRLR